MNTKVDPPTTNPPKNKFSPVTHHKMIVTWKSLECMCNDLPSTPMWPSKHNVSVQSIHMCPINVQNNLMQKAKLSLENL